MDRDADSKISLNKRTKYGYEIIDVAGNISFDDTEIIENFIIKNITEHSHNIVLNLEKVPFINSSALAMLIKIMQKLTATKVRFHIMNANETIVSLMRMTGVLAHFEFIKNEQVLTDSLKKKELDSFLEE